MNIYILVFCEYLYLKGVCVACLTGATCCCVLSKVVESQYIYIKVEKYINPFVIGRKACWKVCSPVARRPSLENYQIWWFCFTGGRAGWLYFIYTLNCIFLTFFTLNCIIEILLSGGFAGPWAGSGPLH